MKRALTGIVAASLTLGAMAPAAFAATTASSTNYFSGHVTLGSYSAGVSGVVANDAGNQTGFFPFYYVQQALNAAGYTVTWDGVAGKLSITTPSSITPDLTNLKPGSGKAGIYINGTLVQNAPFVVAKDNNGKGVDTSFMPIYYINQALGRVGFTNSYNAGAWTLTPPAPAAFGVKSVTPVNGQEIDVTFTQPVNAAQTFSAANLDVTAVGGAQVPGTLTYSLSADGKTVQISTQNVLTQGGYYTVTQNGVQDANLNPLAPTSTTIQFNDKTAPAISSVTATTNQGSTRQFTIGFSEPVQFDLIKVGTVVAGAVSADGGWTYTVTIPNSANALTVGTSYPITINGLRDLEGNYAANPTTSSVAVVQDVTAPTFTLSAVNPRQFNVVFSKKMNTSVNVDSITVKDANGNVLPLAGLPSFASDGKTLHVSLASSAVASGQTSATVGVEVKNLQDSVGNSVADTTTNVTLSKSTVAPTITAARLVPATNNQVQVTFNEPVTTVLTNANFALTDSTGATYPISSVTTQDSNNNVILNLTAPALTATDTYTVALIQGTVTDASGNTNAAATQKFSYTAPASAQLVATIDAHSDASDTNATDTATYRKVTVKFNQTGVAHGIDPTTGAYKAGAADNVANYTWDGTALPTGTTISFVSADAANNSGHDEAVIDFTGVAAANLPSDLAMGGNGVLTVSNVKTSGSTVQYTSNTVTVADKTAPSISAAYITGSQAGGSYTITVAMNEAMSAVAAGEFTFKVNGVLFTAAPAGVVGSDTTKLVFTVNNVTDLAAIHTNPGKVTIDVAAGATTTKDLDGNAMGATASTVAVTNYTAG